MAQSKKVSGTPKKTPTVAEIREWYKKYENTIHTFEESKNILRLTDTNKNITRTYSVFSKDKLRTYMKNPITNYVNLRNLSKFLYYRSPVYRRLIWFNATMIDVTAKSVIPNINLVKGGDAKNVLKSYYDTLSVLEIMNMELEFLKMRIIAWREDIAYGCAFYDDTGYFILPLDPDYCRVSGAYKTGDLAFKMNMTYFQNRQDMLEWIGEPFQSMWNEYQRDTTNGKWQDMPDENCVCFKVNIDDYEVPLPPYMNMFNSLINLLDLEDIQAVADEQQIYKLIYATIPRNNGDEPDNWAVDINTALAYYNKFSESLPEYAASAITPLPLDVISFGEDQTTDVNKIENATKTVFNTSGGAQILNSSTISGTTAWTGAIKSDIEYATASLRPQTEAYLNRFVSYQVSKPAKIRLLKVTPYTKAEVRDQLLKDAQYGIPTALALNTLNGFSELETLSLNFLQNDVLHLTESFMPLQSSHTRSSESGDEGGAPTKPLDQLTDDGEASQDKSDSKK